MISQQPRITIGLRLVAAGCIVLWLLASSYCSIEHLFGDDHHAEANISEAVAYHGRDHLHGAEAAEHEQREAGHSHEAEPPSHDSHPHDGDDICCSTLMATAQIATPSIFVKPLLDPLNQSFPVPLACDSMIAASTVPTECQSKRRECLFTPEVCLGAANRNHAPPVFI